MKLMKECWLVLLEAFNALAGTPADGSQQSLGFEAWIGHGRAPHVPHSHHAPQVPHHTFPLEKDPLIFHPPSHGQKGRNRIQCDYSAMGKGWSSCSTSKDRGCWLQGPPGTKEFNIGTDYEKYAPKGITRKVFLFNSRCLGRHDS